MRIPLPFLLTPLLAAALALPACSSGGGGGSSSVGGSTNAGAGATATTLLAGAAAVDITPPTGAPLGGYGGGPRRVLDAITIPLNIAAAFGTIIKPDPTAYNTLFEPSVGKHDPIRAKALVLEKGGERYAILSIDAIGVSRRARDDIAARLAPYGFANERILVAATHTHSGPAALADKRFWELAAMDIFDQRLYDQFVAGATQAVIDAYGRVGPARLGAAVEHETATRRNRRGLSVIDPEMTTIAVDRPDGTPVALVVNVAIHGICLDADNLHFSADLMGYCEREVESRLGQGAVCLFLNGAEGDVSPSAYGFPGAESVGKELASRALGMAPQARAAARDDLPLAASFESFRFPTPPAFRGDKFATALPGQVNLGVFQHIFGAIYVEMDESWFNRDIPAQAIRLGDLCLIAVPGEPITNVGLDLKARTRAAGFARPVVVGLANDHVGYICDPLEYDKGGYEAAMTFFGRDESVHLSDALLRQVARVRP